MKSVIILGAGTSGLLAARLLAPRFRVVIIEKQPALPNNHSAVLRFRSSIVGDALGIPFKPVQLIKGTAPWMNPVADALTYSYKVTGQYRSDRSINSPLEVFSVVQRWIAPDDLVARMAEGLEIKYGLDARDYGPADAPVISTLPMPELMRILEYEPRPDFHYRSGYNIGATLANCDAYASIQIPSPDSIITRVSITGNRLIAECTDALGAAWTDRERLAAEAANWLGVTPDCVGDIQVTSSRYAKIVPIDEVARRDFLYRATDQHDVFSLGRFATWRPTLMMDDLIKDIRLIEGWITEGRYGAALHRTRR